jgi:protein gp37
MVENSNIEWTHHTFNPWLGCTKISSGCDHCYAEHIMSKRLGRVQWGAGAARVRTSKSSWNQPILWNRRCERNGTRERVFCASLADVFDNEVDPAWRADLFRLIRSTPNLDWLLLTKRIGNAAQMIERALIDAHLLTSREPFWPWPHVWIGSTIANQAEADRDIPKLLATPARVRFLSCEPLLSAIDIRKYLGTIGYETQLSESRVAGIDWTITGGESGSKARPSHPDWFRSLRDQCAAASVAFFMKQIGGTRDKRDALESIPDDLRLRSWPQ